MIDAERVVVGLAPDEQRQLACDVAAIVAPYGHVAPSVVDPAWFDHLARRLQDPATAAGVVTEECRRFIDRFDEEPDGPGFYAFGALVNLYYASRTVGGDSDGALNAVKRFLDLVGSADDEDQPGLYDEAMSYLTMRSTADRDALVRRVTDHASSMT